MIWYTANAKAPAPIHGNQPPVLPLSATPPHTTTPWAAINRTAPRPTSMMVFDLVMALLSVGVLAPFEVRFRGGLETAPNDLLGERGRVFVQRPLRVAGRRAGRPGSCCP